MDLRADTYIATMVERLPADAAAYRRRHELARGGVLACVQHLATGLPELVTPSDLVRLFVASDLFVFDSAYRSAFYNTGRVEFTWHVASKGFADCLLDLAYEPGQRWCKEHMPPGSMQWVDKEVWCRIEINPQQLAADRSVPLPVFLREGERCDLLDRLLWAMCRMMLMAAGFNCSIENQDLGRRIGVDLIRLMRFDGTPPGTVTSVLGGPLGD